MSMFCKNPWAFGRFTSGPRMTVPCVLGYMPLGTSGIASILGENDKTSANFSSPPSLSGWGNNIVHPTPIAPFCKSFMCMSASVSLGNG